MKHRADKTDDRPVQVLFEESLVGDYDEDKAWDAIVTMRRRGTIEVFNLAKLKANSEDPKARARAADIVGQLGAGLPDAERPYKPECVSISMRLTDDPDPMVRHAACWALAHLGGPDATSMLMTRAQDPDPRVRHAVAFGLHGVLLDKAVRTLLVLMNDEVDEVRDWATFSLGSVPSLDSDEIRLALKERLRDSCNDVRDEAIWGLALRRDPMGLKSLLERLEGGSWTQGDEMTACQILGLFGGPPVKVLTNGLRELLIPSV